MIRQFGGKSIAVTQTGYGESPRHLEANARCSREFLERLAVRPGCAYSWHRNRCQEYLLFANHSGFVGLPFRGARTKKTQNEATRATICCFPAWLFARWLARHS